MNISPSNIFPNMLLDKRFHQNYQAVLAALGINGLAEWSNVLSAIARCLSPLSGVRENVGSDSFGVRRSFPRILRFTCTINSRLRKS